MPARKKVSPREVVKRDAATKTTYHYENPDREIDVKSREVWKRKELETHFPFNKTNGAPKYDSIKRISYEGISGALPAGFLKNPSTGYGFTRELNPLLFALREKIPSLEHVIVSGNRKTQVLSKKEIVLNLGQLSLARPKIASMLGRHKQESATTANNILAGLLPSKFKAKTAAYQKGQLSQFVDTHAVRTASLSDDDLLSIAHLLSLVPPDHGLVSGGQLLDTKASFDRIFIEDLIGKFEKLLSRKTDTKNLEDAWQEFFRDHILFFDFGYVQKFEKERIQGDKSINIPDFIMLNTYGFLDVFEIKTHLTQLLSFDAGRKNFYWASEATKAISQAQNYIDSLIKEEDRVIKNIRDEYGVTHIDAVRPFVYVIAGTKSTIAGPNTTTKYKGAKKTKMWNDFRRLNDSLSGMKFVLYDELLAVFRNTLERLASGETEE